MSRSLRNAIAALLLACFASLAPPPAFAARQRSDEGPARIESARGLFAFLLCLFDSLLVKDDSGSGMDPNGGIDPSGIH